MGFDPNVQQQLQMLAMQDPQSFEQILQNANMMNIRNNWNGQNRVQNWNRPVMTQNYGQPTSGLHGRMIASPQEIRPNEISQDGVPSYFPTSDYSVIYAKAWNADGGIDTIKYVQEQPVLEAQGPSQFDQVMARLDRLEEIVTQSNQRRQNYYQNNRNYKGNKEVKANDESQRDDS